MMKKFKAYSAVLLGFILLVISDWMSPKEINLFPSFSLEDKIPLGTYVLYDVLEDLYPDKDIWLAEYPAYNALEADSFENATAFYCDSHFDPDKLDIEQLLEFAARGHTVFISAQKMNEELLDTLNVELSFHYLLLDTIHYYLQGSAVDSGFRVKGQPLPIYFSRFDSSTTTVLGTDSQKDATFIKFPFGEGQFYLHTVPHMFTNYNILNRPNEIYVNELFSMLPLNELIWDEYYKGGRRMIRTPIRYILSQKPLKYAYYLALISAIIFILFQAKRRQRIIPIIEPLKNDSVDFVTTVGRLYYQTKDHKNIAQKMISYFFEYIRTHYYLNPTATDNDFYKKLSAKSGCRLKDVEELFHKIAHINQQKQIDEKQLLELSATIDTFKLKISV